MLGLLTAIVHLLVTIIRASTPSGLRCVAAENLALKVQLLAVRRKYKKSPPLGSINRVLLGGAAFLMDSKRRLNRASIIFSPQTIIAFHKLLVQKKYRKLFSPLHRKRTGPKGFEADIVTLVVRIKKSNPSFGCPRIAMIITHSTGTAISEDTVRRILRSHGLGDPKTLGPSWLSFLATAKDSLWSVDLFRIESVLLQTHWVMVVMDVYSRRIIGFAIRACKAIDGEQLCCMFNQMIQGCPTPKRLSRDRDPLFKFHRWLSNMSILEIEEVFGPPYTPVANPFVERLIGTTRREFLDHILFWNQTDLERKLLDFKLYYNELRVHSGINGHTPSQKSEPRPTKTASPTNLKWKCCCHGLYCVPLAA